MDLGAAANILLRSVTASPPVDGGQHASGRGAGMPHSDLLDPVVRARFTVADQTSLPKGASIDWSGGAKGGRPQLHVLKSGWLAQFRKFADGRRHLLRILLPGDLVGVAAQFTLSRPAPAIALTDAQVMAVSVGDLVDSRSLPTIRQFSAILAADVQQTHGTMVSLGCRAADERLAALLLDLRDRALARGLGTETELRLPLTQRDMADALGISAVHANRMVMKLQGDGLIRLRNERLEILDQAGLSALAQWPTPQPFTPAKPTIKPPKRILIVEDDGFLALHLQAVIQSFGFEVLGPVGSLEQGLQLAETDTLDAAVLDIRLEQGQRVFPIARALQRRSIPFSFMTGFEDPEIEAFSAPVLQKPLEHASVRATIEGLMQ